MAYTDIDKPSDYFNTVLYTGNGTTNSITGVGFQPDFVWTKSRSAVYDHFLTDVILRTSNKYLRCNTTNAEQSGVFSSLDSDGFTISGNSGNNTSGATEASWNWLAGGTAVTNTDGDITSQVSANPTSGFSIVTWTGDGVGNKVGIGLTNPSTLGLAIVKKRSTTSEWQVGGGYSTTPRNFAYHLELNSTSSISGSAPYMMGTQTSTNDGKLRLGTEGYVNGVNYVAYIWQSIKGFSKIGSYTGNGSTDGTFVYTGFKPAFVMLKRTDGTASWLINDSARDTYNLVTKGLFPNGSGAETTGYDLDFLSNGFKIKDTTTIMNASGGTYIYMAFAESPFTTSTGIPTTAR